MICNRLHNGQKIKLGDKIRWVDSDGVTRIDTVKKYQGKLFICNNKFCPNEYKNAVKNVKQIFRSLYDK
jgi:hypothetical protein